MTATAAICVGLGLAFALVAQARAGAETITGVGAIGLLCLAAGVLFDWPGGIAWATGLVALDYVLELVFTQAMIDSRAPAIGAALLLMAELAYWSLELRAPVHDEIDVHRGRGVAVTAVVGAGGALATVPLLAAQLPVPAGVLLVGIGALAAATVTFVFGGLAWRSARRQSVG